MSRAVDLADFARIAREMVIVNKIINGNFDIWQRGTSFSAAATATFAADRWKYAKANTGAVHSISRSTGVPSNEGAQYSLFLNCTTADATIGAGEYVIMQHMIEGYNVLDLVGNTFTLSFWVRALKAGTYCVSFRNSGNDRSYVAEFTVTSDAWEYHTITVPDGLISAGTWDFTNGLGLRVSWALAAGSNFQTTAGAWQEGNFLATANQVNGVDNTSNNFRLSMVQITRTPVALPFEARAYGHELLLCQRYYEKSFDVETAPANNLDAPFHAAVAFNTGNVRAWVPFQVAKRDAPTVTFYKPSAGGANDKWAAHTGDWLASDTTTVLGNALTGGFIANVALSGTFTSNNAYQVAGHWTAEAEL